MRYLYVPLACVVAMIVVAAVTYPIAALGMWMLDHGFGVAASYLATLAAIGLVTGILFAAILPK
jgi:hypothetical protein